jgi:DNA-3-methyladenine glycosylase II
LDPALGKLAQAAGPLPERPGLPGFEGLASVVVSQLVSRASAEAIWLRLSRAVSEFTPENYLRVADGQGPRLGLTAAKADTLIRMAQAIMAGRIDLDALSRLDANEAIASLTSVKGIGPWTAEVYLLFHCSHPDVFPAGDLALRAAYAHAFAETRRPDPDWLRQRAASWSPLRSTAARLLWAYYGRTVRKESVILPSLS